MSFKESGVVKGYMAHVVRNSIIVCALAAMFLVAPAYLIATTTKVGHSLGIGGYAVFAGFKALPGGWSEARAADPNIKNAPAGKN